MTAPTTTRKAAGRHPFPVGTGRRRVHPTPAVHARYIVDQVLDSHAGDLDREPATDHERWCREELARRRAARLDAFREQGQQVGRAMRDLAQQVVDATAHVWRYYEGLAAGLAATTDDEGHDHG